MTSPETHNTNASPLTFSDLIKECESGPFTAHKSQDDDDAHLVDQHGATVALFIPCGDEDRSAFIHAQTCARLLNFARAGGVAALETLMETALPFAAECGPVAFACEKTHAALAILNGQTK